MVLRREFESTRLNWIYPILIGSTITINTFFIIYKGAKGLGLHNTPLGVAFGCAFGAGGLTALITIPLVPKLKRFVKNKFARRRETELKKVEESKHHCDDAEVSRVTRLHTSAEKFDKKTEEVFKYLQIFTAVCDAFSHGANDVANAIGPFAAIYMIYRSGGDLAKKTSLEDDAYWVLAMGGIGIAIGLLVYGRKITYAIGEKLCKITPSRGVAIELSSCFSYYHRQQTEDTSFYNTLPGRSDHWCWFTGKSKNLFRNKL